jgi:hypothetical protein
MRAASAERTNLMIRPRLRRADLIREQMDMEGTFCGPLPAKRGSIAAQRQAADPFGNVGSAPADAASAKVNGRGKLARLDAPPELRMPVRCSTSWQVSNSGVFMTRSLGGRGVTGTGLTGHEEACGPRGLAESGRRDSDFPRNRNSPFPVTLRYLSSIRSVGKNKIGTYRVPDRG